MNKTSDHHPPPILCPRVSGNLNRCPRYHRFKLTSPGNVTFDSCASMMTIGIRLFKRTDNLSKSDARMTSDWKGFKSGLMFDVPLHDSNRQYRTVRTGLYEVQQDLYSHGTTKAVNSFRDPALSPPLCYAKARFPPDDVVPQDKRNETCLCDGCGWHVNGCPLSQVRVRV